MEIDIILKVAGVGIIVAVLCQILSRTGRDEQATLVSVAGIVVIFLLLAQKIGTLISELRALFGI